MSTELLGVRRWHRTSEPATKMLCRGIGLGWQHLVIVPQCLSDHALGLAGVDGISVTTLPRPS